MNSYVLMTLSILLSLLMGSLISYTQLEDPANMDAIYSKESQWNELLTDEQQAFEDSKQATEDLTLDKTIGNQVRVFNLLWSSFKYMFNLQPLPVPKTAYEDLFFQTYQILRILLTLYTTLTLAFIFWNKKNS